MDIRVVIFLGFIVLVLDIWAIISIIKSDTTKSAATTGMKVLWVVLILLLPVVGLIIWWFAGPKASVNFKRNLEPTNFPKFTWEAQKLSKPLDELYEYAKSQAGEAIAWYFCKKKWRRHIGRTLRVIAILLVAFAGILPIVNEILGKDNTISSLWSTLALLVATTLILLDRFYGFTTGWVRFVLAGQQISQSLETFELEIEQQKLNWGHPEPTQDQALATLRQIQQFLKQIREIIHDETVQWAAEFAEVLKQIDEQTKLAAQAERKSMLKITVTNADQCTEDLTLTVGNRFLEKYRGKNKVIEVPPGLHRVRIDGKIDDRPVCDEEPVKVNPGEIQSLELTLS